MAINTNLLQYIDNFYLNFLHNFLPQDHNRCIIAKTNWRLFGSHEYTYIEIFSANKLLINLHKSFIILRKNEFEIGNFLIGIAIFFAKNVILEIIGDFNCIIFPHIITFTFLNYLICN